MAVADGDYRCYGDILAVNAGHKEATAEAAEIFVDGEEHRARVGAGDDAALRVGVYIDHIVEGEIVGIGGIEPEVGHKTEAESGGGGGTVGDLYIAALGIHHTKILFQFLGGVVNGGMCDELVYIEHSDSPDLIIRAFYQNRGSARSHRACRP